MRVLLVEDTDGMRKMIGAMLQDMGFKDLVTAVNGHEALGVLENVDVGLLLTNWSMPVMDGLDLVRTVRTQRRNTNLPIIMFTSRASREDVVQALEAGVDGYVAKPFSPGQLREQIDHVLQRRTKRSIERVSAGLERVRGEDQHPLLVLGERAIQPQDLSRPDNRETLVYLDQVITAISDINKGTEPALLGVTAADDSTDLSRMLRSLGARARAMIVNAQMPGALTLARLVAVNKNYDVDLFVTCSRKADISDKIRDGLDRMEITLLERDRLDVDSVHQLVTEHLLAGAGAERPTELPSPEQIHKRLRLDILSSVSLPVMPKVFHDIAELARDPDSDIQKWIDIIQADPLSSAQVVRRARSPLYGFRGEIQQTDKAVILLGKNTVKELVVSEAVQRAFQHVQEDQFDIGDYWLHSVCVALISRLLALSIDPAQRSSEQQEDFDSLALSPEVVATLQRLNLPSKLPLAADEEPFSCGMMHDIGKVALVQSYPGLYGAVRSELERNEWNIPMRQAEIVIAGGADHTAVGEILAQSWRLGDRITRVIEKHHEPDAGDHLVSLIALADLIAGGIQPFPKAAPYPLAELVATPDAAASDESLQPFLPPDLLGRLELTSEDVIELARGLAPSVRKRAAELHESL